MLRFVDKEADVNEVPRVKLQCVKSVGESVLVFPKRDTKIVKLVFNTKAFQFS